MYQFAFKQLHLFGLSQAQAVKTNEACSARSSVIKYVRSDANPWHDNTKKGKAVVKRDTAETSIVSAEFIVEYNVVRDTAYKNQCHQKHIEIGLV